VPGAGEDEFGGQPAGRGEWVRPAGDVPTEPGGGPRRPGPELFEADSWDGDPGAADATEIRGGRHQTKGRPRYVDRLRRGWLAVGIVVIGLAAVIVVPYAFANFLHPNDGAPVPLPLPNSGVDRDTPDVGQAMSFSPSFEPAPTSQPPSPVTTRPAPPPPPRTTRPPTTPPFVALTFEAEAGAPQVTLRGSAFVFDYPGASNGKVVRNLGNWNMGAGPGSLQLNGVVIPVAGTYVITLSFVHPDNETSRSAVLTVSGVAPVNVSFTGNSTCCGTKKVSVVIPAGTHTVTLDNPTGRAPSIDKIVIDKS
jgi:hypothetical protein